MRRPLDARIWLGVFVLATATLAFEVALTRLYSVAQFYHLAFMIVSIALLGTGASGTALSLLPAMQEGSAYQRLGRCASAAGVSMLGAYLLTNWLPFDSFSMAWDRNQILILGLHYVALSAPFFFSGLALGSLLSQYADQAGKIYAANLTGSALGCLLALVMPSLVGGEGAVVLYAGVAATVAFANTRSAGTVDASARLASAGLIILALLGVTVRVSGGAPLPFLSLRISPYKGLSYALQSPGAEISQSRWNAFSRVDVVRSAAIHSVPGLSYRYLEPLPSMDGIFVDGDDLSPVAAPDSKADFVSYLPASIAFTLHPHGSVLILEPRGGLDILAAMMLTSGPKTVVEANPLVTKSAPVYADPRLVVQTESDRSFLRRSESTYDVIVLSLPSGYHPVRSGAYSLGEDYRYTAEGFGQAVEHLVAGGVMVSTRWLQEPPSEDLRLFALAVAALERTGGNPRTQLVAFRGYNMAAVLLKNGEYSAAELSKIRSFLDSRAFDLSYAPDVRAEETNLHNVLPESRYYETYRQLLDASSRQDFFAAYDYDVRPPSDDRPFFGHYFKWGQAPEILAEFGRAWQPFGGAGYFVILALLVLALLLSGGLILAPVVVRRHRGSNAVGRFRLGDLLYFGSLGFGFLLVEIPLLQMCILYLEQPAYAAAVVLFSLLLFSGIGSWTSPSISLRITLGLLAVTVLAMPSLLRLVIHYTLGLSLAVRMGLTSLLLAPLGFLMGIPFPGGIRVMFGESNTRTVGARKGEIPWVWAVNGAASVIASILAALLALTFGFSWVLRLGALCYAGAFTVEVCRSSRHRSLSP